MTARGWSVLLWAAALAFFLPARAGTLTVFAASSLQGSLDEVARAYERASGERLRVAYAASSALARQIEAGAPAQVFLSADREWIEYLRARGRLAGPPVDLLANELVLVAPANSPVSLRVGPGFALAAALGNGRLAMADPASVPAGKYARAALQALGAWEAVAPRLAPTDNVRSALALVARGETPLGIVYRTDALAEPRVRIVDGFPGDSHPPILYGAARVKGAGADADAFIRFALSGAAREVWTRHGFRAPGGR